MDKTKIQALEAKIADNVDVKISQEAMKKLIEKKEAITIDINDQREGITFTKTFERFGFTKTIDTLRKPNGETDWHEIEARFGEKVMREMEFRASFELAREIIQEFESKIPRNDKVARELFDFAMSIVSQDLHDLDMEILENLDFLKLNLPAQLNRLIADANGN